MKSLRYRDQFRNLRCEYRTVQDPLPQYFLTGQSHFLLIDKSFQFRYQET